MRQSGPSSEPSGKGQDSKPRQARALGGADLDEQHLDRLALLLEVDRDLGQLADVLEPARGQRLVDGVSVFAPRDEVDVGVVAGDPPEQEVERPAAAQPERHAGLVEGFGDLREETELALCGHAPRLVGSAKSS